MAKDLIISGASNYGWKELQYWVNSIKKTGFQGDIVIAATNISAENINKLAKEGVNVFAYGTKTNWGFENQNKQAPHVERFIFIWDYLRRNPDTYRYVVVTDARDVIFQKDPTEFLQKKLLTKSYIASSEGLAYQDEPWGNKNLLDTFGPFVYDELKDKLIYNVGTIAGFYEEVKDLILQLFFQSVNRPIPIVDQAVYNFMINQLPFRDEVLFTNNDAGWAVQLGTTKYAVEAGAGDLGASGNMDKYLQAYKDTQPIIEGHKVLGKSNVEYYIVHQWDRVPSLKEAVIKEYGDSEWQETVTIRT
jgi:hypothetical protein